jgi:hypothetical protein
METFMKRGSKIVTDVKEEITERIPTGGKCLRKKNNQRITNL